MSDDEKHDDEEDSEEETEELVVDIRLNDMEVAQILSKVNVDYVKYADVIATDAHQQFALGMQYDGFNGRLVQKLVVAKEGWEEHLGICHITLAVRGTNLKKIKKRTFSKKMLKKFIKALKFFKLKRRVSSSTTLTLSRLATAFPGRFAIAFAKYGNVVGTMGGCPSYYCYPGAAAVIPAEIQETENLIKAHRLWSESFAEIIEAKNDGKVDYIDLAFKSTLVSEAERVKIKGILEKTKKM